MINYAVVTAIVDTSGLVGQELLPQPGARAPGAGRSSPGTSTTRWGHGCCNVNSNFVTPAEPGDQTSELMAAILAVPEWKAMYFRRLRTVVDQVLAPGRLEALYDAKVGPAAADVDARLRRVALHRPAGPTPASGRRCSTRSPPVATRSQQRRPAARGAERRAEHRDQRDPALTDRRATAPSSSSCTTRRPPRRSTCRAGSISGGIDLTDPAGHGDPAQGDDGLRQQRPHVPGHLRQPRCSSVAASPATWLPARR